MRTVFAVIGVCAAALVAVVLIAFGFAAYRGAGLDKEALQYSEATVGMVTSRWDAGALMARASPAFKTTVTAAQLESLFAWFSVLGPLVHSVDCTGSSLVNAMLGQPVVTSAHYRCSAVYEKGAASIELGLIKQDGVWLVNGFHVNSPVLLAHTPGQKT